MWLFGPPPLPPTPEDKLNGASALSAYAVSTFDRVVADLSEANHDLTDVVDETAAEISRIQAEAIAKVEHLRAVQSEALRQQGQNETVISNVRRLVGSDT